MYCQKQAHLKRKTARFEQRRGRGGRVVNQKCVLSKSEHHKDNHAKQHSAATKMWSASRFCVSSMRRGHANLLCIVPILVYVLPKASTLEKENSEIWTKENAWTKMCFIKIWNLVKTTRIFTQNSTVQLQKCGMLHDFACHPCPGAMLSSVTFQF